MKKIFVLTILLIGSITICTKAQTDTIYNFELSITASPLFSFFQEERYPGGPKSISTGYGMGFRAMWHPGRLLAFGLMSGYLFIVEDEFQINSTLNNRTENASAKLNAVPLQAVVSMRKNGLEIGLGMGPYLLLSTIDYGKKAQSHRFELGLTLFGSYSFSIGEDILVGPELRILYLDYRRILSVMPSLTVRINILSY